MCACHKCSSVRGKFAVHLFFSMLMAKHTRTMTGSYCLRMHKLGSLGTKELNSYLAHHHLVQQRKMTKEEKIMHIRAHIQKRTIPQICEIVLFWIWAYISRQTADSRMEQQVESDSDLERSMDGDGRAQMDRIWRGMWIVMDRTQMEKIWCMVLLGLKMWRLDQDV